MTIIEAEQTTQARHQIIKALKDECFTIKEEEKFYCPQNDKPYQADIYASINFIIELDPPESHGGDHRTKMDQLRDTEIYLNYGVKTVRLQPADILKKPNGIALAFKEILFQLKKYDTKA